MQLGYCAATGTTEEGIDATCREVGLRLIPFLFLLYVVAFLDRVNVGYAKLQMGADLHFSDEVYGLVGPYILGWARTHLQSGAGGLYAVAGFLVVAATLVV